MVGNTFFIFTCITLLISYSHIAYGEDDRYLVCSHLQDEEYPASGWCRPVKRHLETELEDQLEEQMERVRARYRRWTHVASLEGGSNATCGQALDALNPLVELNPEIVQYMETVIAPFLELYHRAIRDTHTQMTHTTHQRTQREMAAALTERDKMYEESKNLIEHLQVPDYCSEEKRAARRVSHHLVAAVARCTERARSALDKMKVYLDEMIALGKKHLGLVNNLKLHLENCRDVASCLTWLSAISVQLGYELEASVTRAHSFQDMSAERLDTCIRDAHAAVRAEHNKLHKQLHYCVEA